MTLQELLADRKLTTALIIDDAYDQVPRAEDLGTDEEAWATFIDDIGDDSKILLEAYPAFDVFDAHQLRTSDDFVAAAWKARDRLQPALWNALFSNYEQAIRSDREFLNQLEASLNAVGIKPIPSGRSVSAEGQRANIIFADLFLGAAQEPADIERSLECLKPILSRRKADPPLVILMSRSSLLNDKKADFRDRAQVLGAMFRVYQKSDLLEGSNLERALERLALHHSDALRVARFLDCWEKGLTNAAERFFKGIRRLDLADYVQIRDILLAFEGQPLGSYLLDVFDRVLQHEIEGDSETIDAAEQLNGIDLAAYPAPHIAGSTDLQDLVYRTIFQNPKRLKVKTNEAGILVGFGDVLVKRQIFNDADQRPPGDAEVLVVLTPACDLVREDGAKRILLLAGELATLTPKTWTYKDRKPRTPIIVLSGDRRMWVEWDEKDIRTLLPTEIEGLLGESGSYAVVLRLRESHALELQQRLLASMGRVGLVAQMPGTFPVNISTYYLGADEVPRQLELPRAAIEGGVCYVGRDDEGNENTRLVLTEPVIDELLKAIGEVSDDSVHPRARDTLRRLKTATSLAVDLQRGLTVPRSDKSGFSPIISAILDAGGQSVQSAVGLIARNPPPENTPPVKHSALILVLSDEGRSDAVWPSKEPSREASETPVACVDEKSPPIGEETTRPSPVETNGTESAGQGEAKQ